MSAFFLNLLGYMCADDHTLMLLVISITVNLEIFVVKIFL